MIKTVKCPNCAAEQAIIRDENDRMKCAFCETEIELPERQEGEGLPDVKDSPELIQTVGEAIEADFILKREEVEIALMSTGKIRKRKSVVWVETVILGIFAAVTIFSIIAGYLGKFGLQKPDVTVWFTLVLAIGLIPFVWIMPNINKKKMIDAAVTGLTLNVKVYENLMEISVEENDMWQLMLDGSYRLIEDSDVMMIVMENGQILAVPERAFKDADLQTAKARIKNGAKADVR